MPEDYDVIIIGTGAGGGTLAHLRSQVHAIRQDAAAEVLDWRFAALLA